MSFKAKVAVLVSILAAFFAVVGVVVAQAPPPNRYPTKPSLNGTELLQIELDRGIVPTSPLYLSTLQIAALASNATIPWPATGTVVISSGFGNAPGGLAPINGDCLVGNSTPQWTVAPCPGGGGTTFPSAGSLVVSTGPASTPSGLAPVNNSPIVGSAGAWVALPSAPNSIYCTSTASVPALCNSSTIQALLGYQTANQPISLSGDTTGGPAATSITTVTSKVNAVAYPANPPTNTVPVVTASNTVSYEGATQLAGVSGFGTMLTQNANNVAITGGAVTGASVTGLPSPANPADAATKSYVDAAAGGQPPHNPVAAIATSALPNSPTYANGTSGVGATLTAGANAALVVDGVTISTTGAGAGTTASRVLVNGQASAFQNGIYTLTTAGSGTVAWVLTRTTDFNTATSGNIATGATALVTGGTANTNTSWSLATTGAITIGTTALNFVQIAASTSYTADNTTLQLASNQFSEKPGGTGNTQLTAGAANTYKGSLNGTAEADIAWPTSCTNGINYTAGTGPVCNTNSPVSVTSATPNIVVTPSPGTGTFTVGSTGPLNNQSSAGYTILTGDNTKTILVGAFTYVLPQAGSTGFASGWQVCFLMTATSGQATLNTTTSLFTGASGGTSLILNPGDWACPNSDGSNYPTMVGHYTTGGVVSTGNLTATGAAVSGAVNNGSGLIRLTVNQNIPTGTLCVVSGVGGVPEANGQFTATNFSATQIDLQGSSFGGGDSYTSGGIVSTQALAAQLTATWTRVTAGAGGGVKLPTAIAGASPEKAKNATGADGLVVWPATGAAIDALAANAPKLVNNDVTGEYWATSTTQWDTQP